MSIYKKRCLNFQFVQGSFFLLFYFAIYKVADSEYNMDIYTSVKISIGAVIRNPEMLKFITEHFKTKTMCKHAAKKSPFVIRYVPD